MTLRRWILGLAALPLTLPAIALEPARTAQNIQRKAVVVAHDAKLYKAAQGDEGKQAPFMQVYFLLSGETNGRVPVSQGPNETAAHGWLDKRKIAEWNTLQMIHFEPQSGRDLARIFKETNCAESFGRSATNPSGCDHLGSEPQLTGKEKDNFSLLIPVFESKLESYQGGFVRVTQGVEVKPQADSELRRSNVSGRIGYDLVLVIDATASMQSFFQPTTQVLRSFVSDLSSKVGGGELSNSLRAGLLFYRDRKLVADCDIGFLTRWEAELTANIESVAGALAQAREAECGSDEKAESVFDGVSRAIQDPKWNDGFFKVILLIGDAAPHPPSNKDKNPLGLDVPTLTKMALERNVRFLSIKIHLDETAEFAALAAGAGESVGGRFRALASDPSAFAQTLRKALDEEWELLTKANQVAQAGISPVELQASPTVQQEFGIAAPDVPVIVANLPPGSATKTPPEFVEGWVPKKIKGKLAVGEYVFMSKMQVQKLANITENIALAAQDGTTDGSEAFLRNLRNSLATMLNVPPDELFRSGESLDSMMAKTEILPFKTTSLTFTAEEVNAWSTADFQRLNKILGEKTEQLRSYMQKPGNQHSFGDKAHIYVPKDLFP